MSNTGADVASAVAGGVDPHWLARIDASLGGWAPAKELWSSPSSQSRS
jgi:hypothetical protein